MIKDQTYALLPWLSQYCFDTVVRLRNLDIDSGHSEEIAAGPAKTILQGTVQGK